MTKDIHGFFYYNHIFSANSDNGNDNSDGCVILEEVL